MPPQLSITEGLGSAISTNILLGIAIAAVASLLISLVPLLQKTQGLCALCIIAAAAFYRQAFTGFGMVILAAYLVMRWLNHGTPGSRRWHWACISLLFLVGIFTLGRVLHWDRPFNPTGTVPIVVYSLDMWLLLRLATLFWEVGSGAIQPLSVSQFLIWTCLPFTIGGPLLRPSQMPRLNVSHPGIWISPAWWLEMLQAAGKLLAVVAMARGQHLLYSVFPQHAVNSLVVAFIVGPLGFYLTTSAYFQFMELLGRPCGFKLPPSFNLPIGRESISGFWMNWNMTATFVFRDYLFYNRWGRSSYNLYFNTILLFTLVGLWHAANAYWVMWGFFHGLLFVTFLLWRKYNGRFNIPWRGTALSSAAARVLTYASVCICWYLPSKLLQKLAGL